MQVRFTNVFVKNLADTVTEELLEGLFSKHGVVTSVVIMKVPSHACTAAAEHICFSCHTESAALTTASACFVP